MKTITKYALAFVLACGISGSVFAQGAPQGASARDVLQSYNAAAERGDALFNDALKKAGDSFKADEDKAGKVKKAAVKSLQDAYDTKMRLAELNRDIAFNLAEQQKDTAAIQIRRTYDNEAQDAQRVFDAALKKAAADKQAGITTSTNGQATQAAEELYAAAVKQAREDFVAKEQALGLSRDKAIDQSETAKQAAIDSTEAAYEATRKQAEEELKFAEKPAEDAYELAIVPGVYAGFDTLKKARQASDILRAQRVMFWKAYTAGLTTADETITELNKLGK